MITSTGQNLNVLICTDYSVPFNWMSFAAWYSVMNTLPHAKINVLCTRNKLECHQLYIWCYKCGVDFFQHRGFDNYNELRYLNKLKSVWHAAKEGFVDGPCIVLDADMMAVREFSPKALEVMNDLDVEFAADNGHYLSKDLVTKTYGGCWFFQKLVADKVAQTINMVGEFKNVSQDLSHLDINALAKVYDKGVVVDDLCSEAADGAITAFTHYGESCANFVKKDWLENQRVLPFHSCFRYRKLYMTANEKRVFELWKRMADVFDTVNKGYSEL